MKVKIHNSDDRDLTTYTLARPWVRKALAFKPGSLMQSSLIKNLADNITSYDNSEDRVLTAHAIVEWKTVYIANAIVYTDVRGKIKVALSSRKDRRRDNIFALTFM